MNSNRNVSQMSAELEFPLDNVDAARIVNHNGLPVVHEINPRDVVELNVSLANDIVELNRMTREQIKALSGIASSFGGNIYGGSSVLSDITGIKPRRYRTTSMSESCANGFLDITSHQVVLGVNNESLGFDIYNCFRKINPVFIALTASSPYKQIGDKLVDTESDSLRVQQYERLCRMFPEKMWRHMPEIRTMDEYLEHLGGISSEVRGMLFEGKLDANWEELNKVRDNGKGPFRYIDFSRLEPHQIYWFVRVRPDHRNIESGGKSLFSLEVRVPDMPTTVQRIEMTNALAAGLAYYIADHGQIEMPLSGEFNDMALAARYGLDAKLNGIGIRQLASKVMNYADKGLSQRGYSSETRRLGLLEDVLSKGNDTQLIRSINPSHPQELKEYLVKRMKDGE